MKNFRIFLRLWIPVIIWAGGIYFLSSIPGLSSGLEYDTLLRKAAHVLEYFILTFLLCRAFQGTWPLSFAKLAIYPAFLSYLYALLDEFHQSFVASRHGCFTDTLIDALGIALFYCYWTAKRHKTKIFDNQN